MATTNLQQYTFATVYINGSLLTEEASVTVDRDSKASEVMTVVKGYSGESPGSAMMTISVECAVPSAGFEFDPGPYVRGVVPIDITIAAAGKTLSTKMIIKKDNFSHSVNSEAKLKFDGNAQWSEWV